MVRSQGAGAALDELLIFGEHLYVGANVTERIKSPDSAPVGEIDHRIAGGSNNCVPPAARMAPAVIRRCGANASGRSPIGMEAARSVPKETAPRVPASSAPRANPAVKNCARYNPTRMPPAPLLMRKKLFPKSTDVSRK